MGLPRFQIQLVAFTAILAIAFLLTKQKFDFLLDDWKVYVTLSAFALVTYVTHLSMVKSLAQRPTLFANRYMASILMKLGVGIILFLGIALTSAKPQVLPYGICFLIIYLGYTIFGSFHATILKNGA